MKKGSHFIPDDQKARYVVIVDFANGEHRSIRIDDKKMAENAISALANNTLVRKTRLIDTRQA